LKTLETYREILMTPTEKEAMLRLQSDISNVTGVTRVVLFGSRARGDFNGNSDYDILVVMDRMDIQIKNEIIHVLHEIEMDYSIPLSPVIRTEAEYQKNSQMGSRFITNIENDGIIIYDSLN